jgi:hypothetical protein
MHHAAHVLVPVSVLREHAEAIRRLTTAVSEGSAAGELEDALRYYTLFGDPEAVQHAGLGTLSAEELFYNQYFWFKRFARQHAAIRGYDAGIEQQAFQLLEQAPPDVNWAIVEQIDNEAGSDSTT